MPPPAATLVNKVKVQLKLSIARLRMVQQRDEALAKTSRRSMAQLLDAGKEESARVRVESIIRSDILTELHEILELYCELLLARAGLLESPVCDPGLEEAVKSILYAAPKTEIKELQQVRLLLAERYGKEFVLAAMDNTDGKVSPKVVRKLAVTPPREELVQGYLEEIAKAYGVVWPRRVAADEDLLEPAPEAPLPDFIDAAGRGDDADDNAAAGGGGDNGDVPAEDKTLVLPSTPGKPRQSAKEAREQEELSRVTPPKTVVGTTPAALPLHVNPPSPSTDNLHPRVTLDAQELQPAKTTTAPPTKTAPRAPASVPPPSKLSLGEPRRMVVKMKDTPDDELARRFAQLKR